MIYRGCARTPRAGCPPFTSVWCRLFVDVRKTCLPGNHDDDDEADDSAGDVVAAGRVLSSRMDLRVNFVASGCIIPAILELADGHSSGHEELLLERGQG